MTGAVNIPLHEVPDALDQFRSYNSVIVCCRSGARSAQAESYLRSKGISHVINGGSWMEVQVHREL